MRALGVSDIGDRRSAELRRPRQAPTGLDELTLATLGIADDGREVVWKDTRQRRRIACAIIHGARNRHDLVPAAVHGV